MGALFSSPKPPPPPPPLPKLDDPAIEEARRKRRLSELKRSGRRSTILTGGAGDITEANIEKPELRKTLGG